MALDDQLAALAAGELDDDTARALRARAAADPALARALARHEQLQRLLGDWEAPAMSEEAADRLEARIDDALAALGDEPLAERTIGAAPLAATGEPTRRESAESRGVVDLDRARARRSRDGGGAVTWPSWGAGAAVAAVLAAVVGTGIVLGGLPGGTGLDTLAGGGEDSAEEADVVGESLDAEASDGSADAVGPEPEGLAGDDMAVTTEESARLGPARRDDVDVDEGELLVLVDLAEATTAQEPQAAGDEDAEDAEEDHASTDPAVTASSEECVEEALRRDTAQADGREVWLLADGTYAERDAVFVVVRTPQSSGENRYEVLAYDPDDCSLLARDETNR